ncbi:hypothetical protein [Pseudomonas sp. YY-1]|uniref:hypothetical protein n=1 Tax=Pseudomonas sp. YY-1 TaxID=2058659 RepID=UPI0012FEFCB0|nr:hypothetical protein [Pseudomonas sp. YY-1]
MSNLALDLLIDAGLLTSTGKAFDIKRLTHEEISKRLSHYNAARISTAESEIDNYIANDKLNALFSTGSTRNSESSILSSALVYDSIILDDPLVTSSSSLSISSLTKGLCFFEWAFELIRANFILILPVSYFNKPSNDIPLLLSEDAFRSSIPSEIHDFIHKNTIIKSVIKSKNDEMLILNEDAFENRRTALHISFEKDYWRSGTSLFLFQTLENCKKNGSGELICQQVWDPNGTLDSEKFKRWAYQSTNQAMRSRLINIYNETYLAEKLGHTYITESEFEANFLSMSGKSDSGRKHTSARFLDANNGFIYIDKPETIIELRDRHNVAFERFNYSLQYVSAQLASFSGEDFDRQAKILFHSEIMPQIDEIRSHVGSISRASAKGGIATLSGLAAALVTGSTVPLIPALMLGVAGALTEALPLVGNAGRIKKKPVYIWHKIVKT